MQDSLAKHFFGMLMAIIAVGLSYMFLSDCLHLSAKKAVAIWDMIIIAMSIIGIIVLNIRYRGKMEKLLYYCYNAFFISCGTTGVIILRLCFKLFS